MKKLLLTAVSTAAIAIAAPAYAQVTQSILNQDGNNLTADVDQTGVLTETVSNIFQRGSGNTARVTQSDDGSAPVNSLNSSSC